MTNHRLMYMIATGTFLTAGLITGSQASPIVASMLDAGGPTAQDLVTSMLSGNSGITVVPGTVVYSGAAGASGTFTNGGTNQSNSIGIGSGILLTSGDAKFVSADLPNTNCCYSVDNLAPGNATLDAIVSPLTTFNASTLSFSFIPNGNKVRFSYVFGSEEYNNYVNTQYNDVFAFMVNGVNYATVPATSTFVSVNNVNCGGPVDGPANGVNPSNCAYFRDNPPGSGIIDTQLDGMTVVLDFIANVNSNSVNTIFLGVADVSDPVLDSAVFIKGGSFSTCGAPNEPECEIENKVPEPGTIALLGLGLASLGLGRRRRI